jgi:hypothetical protein
LVTPTFTAVTLLAGIYPEGFTFGNPIWGDFDNDGNLDLFVENHYELNSRFYRNNGDGTFTDIRQDSGISPAGDRHGSGWGDFNNDGNLDLFITRGADNGSAVDRKRDELYLNTGIGQFTDVTLAAGTTNIFGRGRGVAWAFKGRFLSSSMINLPSYPVRYINSRDVRPRLRFKL